ncbi:alpha/beta hydrolase family protein [Pseudonocardia xinjiangensis]|uniref:alpha/beta hydrolase family protein n=1 Tax=Pseudonocardia xinjiangensis TaxID=75289 RepID=UPI003D922C76
MTTSPSVRPAASASRALTTGFFGDPDFDFETRLALGATTYGVGDPGSVLATVAGIADGDRPGWFTAWSQRGDRFSALGAAADSDGDAPGAMWAYLAASAAYSQALGAVDGLPRDRTGAVMLPTFRSSRRAWDAMIDASGGRFVRVAIPYDGDTLPGYLLRPDAGGAARPTFVMTNGSDGPLSSLWSSGAAEALARGWNAFVYDGPGQQSLLFERGVPFRPDWEAVLTPVVDTLVARADVDPSALTAYGISQAGYWLPRALAFEHRFVAAVADPGVVDVSTSWLDHMPPEMIALLDGGRKDTFNGYMAEFAGSDPDMDRTFAFRARPYGIDDPFDLFTTLRTYQLRDVAAQIRTPLLITDPEDEQFWPGQSAQLAALLTAPHEIASFGVADGANFHCQPLAPRQTAHRVFGWLSGQLAGRGAG